MNGWMALPVTFGVLSVWEKHLCKQGTEREMSVVNLLKHCKLLHSYLKRQYLFVLCVHIHFFGADCFADVFDVVLSAVVEYVFVLFPVVQQTKEKTSCVKNTKASRKMY